MELKDQLIHDICVLQERINCCHEEASQRLEDAEKLMKRQKKAVDMYIVELDRLEEHKIIREYRERARNTAKVKTLELLFAATKMHMASPNNGDTIYSFQFDKIIEQIDEIYHPPVCLDDDLTFTPSTDASKRDTKGLLAHLEADEEGIMPRYVDPMKGDEIVEKWNEEAGSKSVEP